MTDIVLLGDRDPSMPTHRELDATIPLAPSGTTLRWISTDSSDATRVADADGLWLVPGSPYRDEPAVFAAIERARTTGQPFLGTCGGFQYAMVEFARAVAGITDASHAETDPDEDTDHPTNVIERLACSLVAEVRTVRTIAGTRTAAACGDEPFEGFHWCNFGLATRFVDRLVAHGLVIGATADDAGVEAVELPAHPFYLATLFQPQVGSLAGQPLHPLLRAFIAAAGG